jgi:hypothetical protein
MGAMDNEIRKRLRWVQLYEELGNAGTICLKCGISRLFASGGRDIKNKA